MAIDEAFFPTSVDVEVALQVLAMVETLTAAKGQNLVEVNQDRALAVENAQLQSLELRPRILREVSKRVLVVSAPTSMLAQKVFYATRSFLGQLIRHDRVVEFDANGQCVEVPVRIHQVPLLLVKMPMRASASSLYFAVMTAIDEVAGTQLLLEESRARRNVYARAEVMVRALAALHVGAVVVVGINSWHAKSQGIQEFLAAVGCIANSGIGVVLSTTSALLHTEPAVVMLDLLTPVAPTEIIRYAREDHRILAEHYWALLDRTEAMPDRLVAAFDEVHGQREWIKLLLVELNRRLHSRGRPSVDLALQNLVGTACSGVSKYMKLWGKQELEAPEAARARDWLPLHVRVQPKPKPEAQ